MTSCHARLIAVAITTVSFSTPITAQQEPTSPPTLETLVETFGGRATGGFRVSQNERGEVVGVRLTGREVTDADLAHLTGLTALESLDLTDSRVTGPGLAHLAGLPALESLDLSYSRVTGAGLAHLAGFPALRSLVLAWRNVTEAPRGISATAGLANLTELTALEHLYLMEDIGITVFLMNTRIAKLQQLLPNCTVESRYSP